MKATSLLMMIGALLISACTINHMNLRNRPALVIQEAENRLKARGMTLDPAGRGPNQLRTATFCWQEPNHQNEWRDNFSKTRPGSMSFTVTGSQSEQDQVVVDCPAIFQVRVRAMKQESGSRIEVDTAWWNIKRGPCAVHGDPLLGQLQMRLRFHRGPGEIGHEHICVSAAAGTLTERQEVDPRVPPMSTV